MLHTGVELGQHRPPLEVGDDVAEHLGDLAGPLTRPVHVGHRQRGVLHPVTLAVHGQEIDHRPGRHRADGARLGAPALLHRLLAGRHLTVEVVGVDRGNDLAEARPAGDVEDVEQRGERAFGDGAVVGVGGDAGRQKVDDVGRPAGDQVGERRRAAIERVHRQGPRRMRASAGEVAERTGRQVVDDVDRVTFPDQPFDEMRTKEAGTAHHERPHKVSPARGCARRAGCCRRRCRRHCR